MRILIVEDEVIIAEDLADIVRSTGFEAETAYSFDEAIEASRIFRPDVVFCDINLDESTDRDGVAFVQTIRNDFPLVVVVYISALVNEKTIKKAQQTKPYSYLVKPFNAKQVSVTATMIRDMLQGQVQQISKWGLLTDAEQKVIKLVAKGLTSKEISEQLYVSEKTIRNHRYNILKKLDLPNTNNSLTKWAMSNMDQHT